MQRAGDDSLVADANVDALKSRIKLIVTRALPLSINAQTSEARKDEALRREMDARIVEIFSNFDYPGRVVQDSMGFVEQVSSLRRGTWYQLLRQTADGRNDAFWDSIVESLYFIDMRNSPKPLSRMDMKRVMGYGYDELDRYNSDIRDHGIGSSERDALFALRGLFVDYLKGYSGEACTNFLVLFVRFLALRRMLAPIGTLMPHEQPAPRNNTNDAPPNNTNDAPPVIAEEVPAAYSEDTQYQFISTLELYRNALTQRFVFYQEREDETLKPFCVQLRDAPQSLQQFTVAGRVLRLLKFYHDGHLILHLKTSATTVYIKMDCSDMTRVTRRDGLEPRGGLKPDSFDDCFFIDADARPYDTTFCTTQRAARSIGAGSEPLVVLSITAFAVPPTQTVQAPALSNAQKRLAIETKAAIHTQEADLATARKHLEDVQERDTRRVDARGNRVGEKPINLRNAEYFVDRAEKALAALLKKLPPEAPKPIVFDPFLELSEPAGEYIMPQTTAEGKTGDASPEPGQRIMHRCRVVSLPHHRAQTTYIMVAVLCEVPLYPGEKRAPEFELRLHRFEFLSRRGDGERKRYVNSPDEPIVFPLPGKLLRQESPDFTIDDFQLVFYTEHTFCVQIDFTEKAGGDKIRSYVSTSQILQRDFAQPLNDEKFRAVLHPHFNGVIRVIKNAGFRTLHLESHDTLALKYDYVFYGPRPSGGVACRFIFMKLDATHIPAIYWVDVEGVDAQNILYMTPENTRNAPGYLYVCAEVEVMGALQRQLLHITGYPTREHDSTSRAHLQSQFARLTLNATQHRAGHCALCGDATTQCDSLSGAYYCAELCQALACQTGRILY